MNLGEQFFGAAAIVWCSIYLVVAFAAGFAIHRGLHALDVLDVPNSRSSHSIPIVRGGGIQILVCFLLGLILLSAFVEFDRSVFWSLPAILSIAAISFLDDCRGVSAKLRLFVHVVCASIVGILLYYNNSLSIFTASIVVFWLVGSLNAYNFMDGINGLAAGQGVWIALGSIALLWEVRDQFSSQILLFALTGVCCLAFLPHIFPGARMFLGDVGSVSLGFGFASIVAWIACSSSIDTWLPLVCLHMNFGMDTFITLIRRIVRGDNWTEPHREHFYQRHLRAGYSHVVVTCTEYAGQIAVIVGLLCLKRFAGQYFAWWGLLWTATIWLGYFAFAEREFNRRAIVIANDVQPEIESTPTN